MHRLIHTVILAIYLIGGVGVPMLHHHEKGRCGCEAASSVDATVATDATDIEDQPSCGCSHRHCDLGDSAGSVAENADESQSLASGWHSQRQLGDTEHGLCSACVASSLSATPANVATIHVDIGRVDQPLRGQVCKANNFPLTQNLVRGPPKIV